VARTAFVRQLKRADCLTGLTHQSVKPAACNSAEFIRLPKPANKMSRVLAISGSAFLSRAKAKPSMLGMSKSMMANE
jgi:hypothetical protein